MRCRRRTCGSVTRSGLLFPVGVECLGGRGRAARAGADDGRRRGRGQADSRAGGASRYSGRARCPEDAPYAPAAPGRLRRRRRCRMPAAHTAREVRAASGADSRTYLTRRGRRLRRCIPPPAVRLRRVRRRGLRPLRGRAYGCPRSRTSLHLHGRTRYRGRSARRRLKTGKLQFPFYIDPREGFLVRY